MELSPNEQALVDFASDLVRIRSVLGKEAGVAERVPSSLSDGRVTTCAS